MKKYTLTFLAGLIIGLGIYWLFRDGPLATKLKEQPMVAKAVGALQEKALERTADEMKDEMEKHGQVVVNKPSAAAPIEDGLLKDLVDAKIAADPLTSKAAIKSSTEQGKVELRGTASSYEQVARAIRLALECDATGTVVSKIEVKAP